MKLRPGTPDDAPVVATLHASRITEGFLPTLGPAFLTRLYRRIARHPRSILIVAEEGGAVIGFAAATEDIGRLYRDFVLRDGLVAAAVAAPRLARSWRRVLETLRYPAGESRQLPPAELVSVAVASQAQGRGVGRALVQEATAELRRRGVGAVRVVTAEDNRAALGLYGACGFRPAARFEVHRGAASEVLTWS